MRASPGEPVVIVRVVGGSEELNGTIEAAGHTVSTEPSTATTRTEPSVIITSGERALLAVAREQPNPPILPLDIGIGPTIKAEGIGDGAVEKALENGIERLRPLLSVSIDGELVERAFMDVTLVTREPARISEYAINHDERVARFRADGVVVATPAGSHGYAAAAGGPTLSPSAEALCVVPIAPFHTQSEQWVLDTGPTTLSVLRDEGEVSLLIDDIEYGSIDSGQRVRLAVDGSVRTLHPSRRELETL